MKTKCDRCGHFIGADDDEAMTWTPYGGEMGKEPLKPEYECGSCVAIWDQRMKGYTSESVWIPAHKINEITKEK